MSFGQQGTQLFILIEPELSFGTLDIADQQGKPEFAAPGFAQTP
jgi:hypothetical protein